MEITADRTFRAYSETFNSIVISAEGNAFIDKADASSRSQFWKLREFKDRRYISRFEIILPNYKFDVVKYAQAFTVNYSIGGVQRTLKSGAEEIRLLQDAGLIMSMAGLM